MIKKGRLWGLLCIGCFAFLFMSVSTKAATSVQRWGQLKVAGTNIVDKTGKKGSVKRRKYTRNCVVSAICK